MNNIKDKIKTIIVNPQNTDMWKRCESLEYNIFLKTGYIKPTPEKRIKDYDPYHEVEMIAALKGKKGQDSQEKILTGVYRYIVASKKNKMDFGLFPTIDAYEKLGISDSELSKLMKLNPQKVIDTTSMAVSPEYRDYVTSKLLWTRMFTRAWELGIRYGVAAIDHDFFLRLQKRFPCRALGPSKMYWGSYTTPTFIDSYDFARGTKKIIMYSYRAKGQIEKHIRKKIFTPFFC